MLSVRNRASSFKELMISKGEPAGRPLKWRQEIEILTEHLRHDG